MKEVKVMKNAEYSISYKNTLRIFVQCYSLSEFLKAKDNMLCISQL